MANEKQNQIIGGFEELVLRAVMKLGENNAYGVPIAEMIEEATGRRVSTGALYTTLARLEEKNFVRSWTGEATAERGGRAKKFFVIEANGRQALMDADYARRVLSAGMEPVLI